MQNRLFFPISVRIVGPHLLLHLFGQFVARRHKNILPLIGNKGIYASHLFNLVEIIHFRLALPQAHFLMSDKHVNCKLILMSRPEEVCFLVALQT